MEAYTAALQKIIPKELTVLRRRYKILRGIHLFQPIGRRSLSDRIHLSEKLIRTDTEFMRDEGFISSSGSGMTLEPMGMQLIHELKDFMEQIEGLSTIEEQIKEILECEEVVIVSGDADLDDEAIYNIGHAAARVLLRNISNNDIIALTGGSTVHRMIEAIPSSPIKAKNVYVVPARGSLGNNVSYQANTLVARLAEKIHSKYTLLNIPDNLSQKSLESVREEPEIQETLNKLIKSNILIYGIGNASKMSERRNLGQDIVKHLTDNHATAEALGYYFDQQGEVIYASRSIGITIDQMTELKYPIAVAGGRSKSDAILSVKKLLSRGCVIMDEGAANGVIALFRSKGQ
jgi:central glycolytic genes regulator